MRLTRSMIVATLLVGVSAFAFDNTKTSGDARLFYYADDSKKGLFNKDTARAQAKLA